MIDKHFHVPRKLDFHNLTVLSSPDEAKIVPVMFHSTFQTYKMSYLLTIVLWFAFVTIAKECQEQHQ